MIEQSGARPNAIDVARAVRRVAEEGRTVRHGAGLSQQAIADELGVNLSTVIRWEAGRCRPRRRHWPHVVAYERLLRRLQEVATG